MKVDFLNLLSCFRTKFYLVVGLICIFFLSILESAEGKPPRRHTCDPKFGYKGNYIEITTGDAVASVDDIWVCLGRHVETKWYDSDPTTGPKGVACLQLSSLPGRFRNSSKSWSQWRTDVLLDQEKTTFQFALCGSSDDLAVWEKTHKYMSVDSWDYMSLYTKSSEAVMIEKLRVVQNRVRILDNEKKDEGYVGFLLKAPGNNQLEMAQRIKMTKLRRVNCLNIHSGPPYCEESVPGLHYQEGLPPVVESALMELGHSGSVKYLRKDNAYCSEFAFYIFEKVAQLSKICKKNVPNPLRENLNVRDMFRWFKSCERIIPYKDLKKNLKAGDYLSTGNQTHSTIFLGWTDFSKQYFWEISGNNQCKPERETFFAPRYKGNMICIAKHLFTKAVKKKDFGGRVSNTP